MDVLKSKSYPGRGIIIGRVPADCLARETKGEKGSSKMMIAYFIMGRSENSRNRVFVKTDNGIKTKAFDEKKLSDPSLIIYNPVIRTDDYIIVTNGSQTDEINEMIKKGISFKDAIDHIEFEPDAPYYTPRISGILNLNDFSYTLSIAKTANGDSSSCNRFIYSYSNQACCEGHLIHTYGDDDKNLPSFCGEPLGIRLCGDYGDNEVCGDFGDDVDKLTNTIWNSLNRENKVSLYTCFIDTKTGEIEERIVNKN